MPSWRAGRAPIHSTPAAMPPERKRRAQSFFGLHFDFHADDRAGIGAGLTEAAIDAVLARVRPDSSTRWRARAVPVGHAPGRTAPSTRRTPPPSAPMRGISSCPSSTRLGEEGAHSTKSAVQVQQEAAHVIAQGGGIQCYFPQKPDGSLAVWQAGLMERLARFCRLRERHCFRSRTVPQVALLHSTFDYYRRTGALFMGVDRFGHWYGELLRVHGALAALLDNQLSVDVLVEERLEPRLDALRSGRTVPARPHRRAARLHRRGRAPPVSRAAGGGAGLACGRRGGATDGRRAQGPPAQHRRPARRPAGSRLR